MLWGFSEGRLSFLVVLAALPLAWDRIVAAFARRAPQHPFRFGVGLGVVLAVGAAFAPAIVLLSVGEGANAPVRYGIAGVSLVIVVTAVAISKRRDLAIGGGDDDGEPVSELDASAPDSGAVTAPGEAVDESLTHGDHLEANAPR